MANGRDRRRSTSMDNQRGDDFHEDVVKINRCAKVMKGGRRFSFSALVVVGDCNGTVGIGFGKANDVPTSVEKGVKEGRKSMRPIIRDGTTIPHEVYGRFGAARVMLLPAPQGTGVIAGASVRSVLVGAGIQDVLTKSLGSNNAMNLVKATYEALLRLRSKEQVASLRGVEIS